jgi:hypothetical protein
MREFDKNIKEKLFDYESQYSQNTWANIQSQLPKKEKRPFGFLFFASIFILIALGLGLLWNNNSRSLLLPDANKEVISSTKKETVSNFTPENEDIISGASKKTSDIESKKDLTSNEIVSKTKTDQENGILKNELLSIEKPSKASNIVSRKNNVFEKTTRATTDKSNTSPSNFQNQDEVAEGRNDVANQTISLSDLQISEESAMANASNINFDRNRNENLFFPFLTLPSFGRVFGTDESNVIENIQLTMKRNASLPCPTFVRKENLSFFEVYFSNDYSLRNLKAIGNESQTYLEKRENTELPYISYSMGARFGIGWRSGIAFKTGFNFSQINEKFNYVDPKAVKVKTITITDYVYDSNYNIIDSVKTQKVYEIQGSNAIVNFNKYRFFDIPILFQYTIPGKKRLSYSLTAGPLINLAFSQDGKFLSEDGASLNDLGKSNYYKANIGLTMYTSIAINYQLTKNMHIIFEPNFRYTPNTISEVQNPLNQKYMVTSISAGLRYKI